MAGLVPAIHEGPAHRRRQARKALRPSAFLPVAPRRDSFLRRPGVDGRDKPGHDGKGSTNEQQTGRPTDNAIRAKIRALIALAVVGKESGAWRRWRTAPSRRHGRACPGHPRRPSASTQASAKSLATVRLPAGRAEADSFLRRPGVDGRDKPGHDGKGSTNEQQTGRPTHNAIRAKIRALIALAVVGKESGAWRRWRTAPSRRHGRACPGHPRRPSASTQASAKSLATVRLPAGRAEAGLVLAAARRGWPGQARP